MAPAPLPPGYRPLPPTKRAQRGVQYPAPPSSTPLKRNPYVTLPLPLIPLRHIGEYSKTAYPHLTPVEIVKYLNRWLGLECSGGTESEGSPEPRPAGLFVWGANLDK